MPADCSLSCAGPFLQFAQECQAIIAAMPIAGELNALVDKCHAAGGVASGGCPCGDVAQKAEVDSLRERLAKAGIPDTGTDTEKMRQKLAELKAKSKSK